MFSILEPDVVYWRHGKRGLLAAALAAKFGGRRFVYAISHVADGRPWRSTYGSTLSAFPRSLECRAWVRWISGLLDPLRQTLNFLAVPLFVDVVTSNNRDFLEGVPCASREVIHNSMRTESVQFSWPRPFVVWVANIKSRKRPDDFYELSRSFLNSGVDFIMVGAIQDSSYSEKLAEWTKADNFHYLGAKSLAEVNGILAASLFLVHTCDPEGFPNNCIQAWLQGRPVVSLRFDPEGLIERERLGRYSKSFRKFRDDVDEILRDDRLRRECGMRASAYAEKSFAINVSIERLEAVFGRLAGISSSPGGAILGRSRRHA